jgi:hypothetical protein
MTTRVATKGQIVLPAETRKQDGIEAGQEFDIDEWTYTARSESTITADLVAYGDCAMHTRPPSLGFRKALNCDWISTVGANFIIPTFSP